MKQKILNLLTMCRRAGQLVLGADAVKDDIASGRVMCVICAEDLSPKSEKEIRFFAESKGVPIIKSEVTMDDMLNFLGRRAGIAGVCTEGFAKQFIKLSGE